MASILDMLAANDPSSILQSPLIQQALASPNPPQGPFQVGMEGLSPLSPQSIDKLNLLSALGVKPQPKVGGILGKLRGALDTAFNDPTFATLLSMSGALLEAGGPHQRPVSLGQALNFALQSGMATNQQFVRNNAAQQELDQRKAYQDAQLAAAASDLDFRERQQADLQKDRAAQDRIERAKLFTKPPTSTDDIKEYELAKSQGYTGSFMDFKKALQAQGSDESLSALGLTPDALKTAVSVVASNPDRMKDYAPYGKAGKPTRDAINNGIAELKKETGMTDTDFIRARSRAHAQTRNLSTLSAQQAQVEAADRLARANGDRVLELIGLVDQTGIPLIEGFTRSARRQAGGVDVAELKSVMQAFKSETARILSGSPNMTGVVSDTLREEIGAMTPENMSAAQAKRVINRLYAEMDIRKQAIAEQLEAGVGTTVVGMQPSSQFPGAPAVGTVVDGHTYLGGDPNKRESWSQ